MSDTARLTAAWVSVLAVAAALLAATGYRTRDPDSRAYITITTRLADEPTSRWVAPQWWGAWGGQGLFREHPAGTFIPSVLLVRAGYPAGQSLFVASLTAQIVALLTLSALAARRLPAAHARVIVWALQLLPIAFVFRIRANHEYVVLAGLLLAVYGVERARVSVAWTAVALAGTCVAVLVKGVFGLLAPVLAGLWLAAQGPSRVSTRAWLALLVLAIAPIPIALAYERAYVAATGQSFLDYYLGARIGLTSGAPQLPFPLDKLSNAAWYLGRVLWFAAPWSLAAAAAMFRGTALPPGSREWIRFSLLAAVVTIVLVAARDTKADRYVFPAYFLAASGGVAYACHRWRQMNALATRLDRVWPWGPAVLWLLLVVARIAVG